MTGLYVLAALAVTYPVILDLGGRLLGGLRSDACTHLWAMWWTGQTVQASGELLFTSAGSIRFPAGGSLVSCSPLNDLISLPFQAMLGSVAAYNLVVLFNLVLSALGAFALVRYLTGHAGAAFLSGLAFAFCPFILSSGVASGGSELASTGWFPLATLALLRTLRQPGWLNPVLGGLAVAAMDLTCVYYVSVFVLFGAALAAYHVLWGHTRRGDLVQAADPGRPPLPRPGWRMGARLLLFGLVAAAVALPHLYQLSQAIQAPDSVLEPGRTGYAAGRHIPEQSAANPDRSLPQAVNAYSHVFLAHVVRLGSPQVQTHLSVTRMLLNPYIGLALLALAGIGLYRSRRGPGLFWAAVAVAFLAIAMGPFLVIKADLHLEFPSSPVYLLLNTLYAAHPVGHEASYYLVTVLAVAGLAGVGAAALLRRLAPGWRPVALAAMAGLLLVDSLLLSGNPLPLPSDRLQLPACYQEVAARPGRFGVLEVPFRWQGSGMFSREHFCYQTGHGKPIVETIIGFPAPYMKANAFVRVLLGFEDDSQAVPLNEEQIRQGFRGLINDGFRFIVAHRGAYQDTTWRLVEPLLEEHAGPPRVHPDGCRLYRIGPEGK